MVVYNRPQAFHTPQAAAAVMAGGRLPAMPQQQQTAVFSQLQLQQQQQPQQQQPQGFYNRLAAQANGLQPEETPAISHTTSASASAAVSTPVQPHQQPLPQSAPPLGQPIAPFNSLPRQLPPMVGNAPHRSASVRSVGISTGPVPTTAPPDYATHVRMASSVSTATPTAPLLAGETRTASETDTDSLGPLPHAYANVPAGQNPASIVCFLS